MDQNAADAEENAARQPLPRRSGRLQRIALGLVLGSLLGLAAAAAVLAIARRDPLPPFGFDELNAAAQRWEANGPRDYDMDLELTGINPGVAHVEVRQGKVTAMTLNGRPTKQHLWDDWAVPGLFAIIRRDLESCLVPKPAPGQSADAPAPQPVYPHGLFDPHYGYPAQYHRITPTGADAQWKVTRFEVKK
jgi:hypothetical protein